MCYIVADTSLHTRGDTTKTATMNKKNRRNNIAHIRMLIIRIWVAATSGPASSRSKQFTLVPENGGIGGKPEYVALPATHTRHCGGLYFVADAHGRRRRKYMRSE